MFPPFSPNPVFTMIRQLLSFFVFAAFSSASAEEVLRALPVDPSDITPESGLKVVDPTPPPAEAKPLPPSDLTSKQYYAPTLGQYLANGFARGVW